MKINVRNGGYSALSVVGILIVVTVIVLFLSHYYSMGAAQHYQASNGIYDEHAKNAIDAVNENVPEDRFTRAQVRLYNIMHDDRFDNMYRGQVLDAVANDYFHVMNDLNMIPAPDADFMLMQMHAFNDTYNPALPFGANLDYIDNVNTVRSIQERKQAAAAEAIPAKAVEKYFEESIQYTPDPQNVHDRAVVSDLSKTLSRIRMYEQDTVDSDKALRAADEFILRVYGRSALNSAQKASDARRVLARIAERNYISSYNDTEDNIFASVWGRADHPSNGESADIIREAIIDSLADSVQNCDIVCINGRTSRVLNSLATIDSDSLIADAAMTKQTYKNQVFAETQEIIKREIEHAKSSTDPALSAVGRAFEGSNEAVDSAAEQLFVQNVKEEIGRNLEQYHDKFTPDEFSKITAECHAGIDF